MVINLSSNFRRLKKVKERSREVANRLLGQRETRVQLKVVRASRVASLQAASLGRKGIHMYGSGTLYNVCSHYGDTICSIKGL